MVALDPKLPETFRKRVIQDRDDEYVCWFLSEFKKMLCSEVGEGDKITPNASPTSP